MAVAVTELHGHDGGSCGVSGGGFILFFASKCTPTELRVLSQQKNIFAIFSFHSWRYQTENPKGPLEVWGVLLKQCKRVFTGKKMLLMW